MSVDIRVLRVLAALDEEESMATFGPSDDLQKAEFRDVNLERRAVRRVEATR